MATGTGMLLFIDPWLGLIVCFPAWLLSRISDPAMIGLALALSWRALVLEPRTAVYGPSRKGRTACTLRNAARNT
jgi:hypothetical protein